MLINARKLFTGDLLLDVGDKSVVQHNTPAKQRGKQKSIGQVPNTKQQPVKLAKTF
jgi:hypothetical protein